MKVLIFTDLDGCLLNHDDYSVDGALKTLLYIKERAFPLIMTTSKTRLEVERLQQMLALQEPFIVENGGGIFLPQKYHWLKLSGEEILGRYRLVKLGMDYREIRDFFAHVKETFHIRGFEDMDSAVIAERTGLSLEMAELAKKREFSEPFVFMEAEHVDELVEQAGRSGIAVTRGGRFYHLIGRRQSKGNAVKKIIAAFNLRSAEPVKTIGVGDSVNDAPLLAEVDIPILIPHPDGSFEQLDIAHLRKAPWPGSRGWGESVQEALDGLA